MLVNDLTWNTFSLALAAEECRMPRLSRYVMSTVLKSGKDWSVIILRASSVISMVFIFPFYFVKTYISRIRMLLGVFCPNKILVFIAYILLPYSCLIFIMKSFTNGSIHALWYIRVWNIRASTQKLKINKGHECLIWKF